MPPEQRREHLIDAALEAILERGYAGVSIEAIAREAGITRPVVYDHFPNLNRLLHAVIEREERISLAQLAQVVPEQPSGHEPGDLLAAGVTRFLDAVTSRPATWRIILLPLEGTPAIVREHVEVNRARVLARIEALVRWAVERSEHSARSRRGADRARDSRLERAGRPDGADRSRAISARALRALRQAVPDAARAG